MAKNQLRDKPKAARSKTFMPFNIMIVGQKGRLQFEALVFVASLREMSPGFQGRLIIAEPAPGPKWPKDPRMDADIKAQLIAMGAEIVSFESNHFGADYPYGNKIEGLKALPADEPFVFFDTDTLITGELSDIPFDFDRPAASMQREATWPKEELYWPGHTAVWKSLYDKFDIDFETSLDQSHPEDYWQRYLYFNAGWFFGADPAEFGRLFTHYAVQVRDNRPDALIIQLLDPWLDQVVLPLVIHKLGGGRPGPELAGLDGEVTCHWRALPLLYARESDAAVAVIESVTAPNKIKKLLKLYDPFKRTIYQGRGQRIRAMFDRDALPRKEKQIRNQIKSAGLWMR